MSMDAFKLHMDARTEQLCDARRWQGWCALHGPPDVRKVTTHCMLCRFLVAGRTSDDGTFKTLADIDVPKALQVPPSENGSVMFA